MKGLNSDAPGQPPGAYGGLGVLIETPKATPHLGKTTATTIYWLWLLQFSKHTASEFALKTAEPSGHQTAGVFALLSAGSACIRATLVIDASPSPLR
jgi:hypothetical protein